MCTSKLTLKINFHNKLNPFFSGQVTGAHSEEATSETTTLPISLSSSTGQSSSSSAPSKDSSLPNSSRLNPSQSSPSLTQKASQEKPANGHSLKPSPNEENNDETKGDSPLRGDLIGVQRRKSKPENPLSAGDGLSNVIQGATDEEFDNTIAHQNDQRVNSTSPGTIWCKNDSTCLSNTTRNTLRVVGTDDEKYQDLQNILRDAKMTILKFQREFEVNESFRELRRTTWSHINKTKKAGESKNPQKSSHGFLNFRLPVLMKRTETSSTKRNQTRVALQPNLATARHLANDSSSEIQKETPKPKGNN